MSIPSLQSDLDFDYKFGFAMPERSSQKTKVGLNADIVTEISTIKGEPEWMLAQRLKAYRTFVEKPMPSWGANLSGIDFDNITYYLTAT